MLKQSTSLFNNHINTIKKLILIYINIHCNNININNKYYYNG